MRPKVYKLQKIEIFWKTETPLGVSNGPKMLSGQILLVFSVTPYKKSNLNTFKYSQKYFEITFG